jgi:hypothetical protein
VTVHDKAGDPVDNTGKRYPERRDVDIRVASLTKTSGGLRLVVQTAAPSVPTDLYSLFYNSLDGTTAASSRCTFSRTGRHT